MYLRRKKSRSLKAGATGLGVQITPSLVETVLAKQ
jgi:signal transduction histidine kinase